MVMVVVDNNSLQADSQPKSGGRRPNGDVLHKINRVNSLNDPVVTGHDDSTINIVLGITMPTPPPRWGY